MGAPQAALSFPTLTDANAEETEEEVDLVQAAADWSKGEEHGGQEDEAQGQGQEYEALAHVNVNWGGELER